VESQRWELPDDLPVVERQVVRLVVLDTASRVLLFHTHDPTYPELGEWWELPGGGIEADETYVDAAIRELGEETGIVATAVQVGVPTWQRHATFRYRGERRLQHEVVVTVHLSTAAPAVDGALRVGYEEEDYFAYRWWAVDAIAGSSERFYPGRLAELISAYLGSETIDEPYEVWS
jgi:8-oxo-dGTP pyrophosphatase MutT (NUDIX family)